jgi:isochorismate synthase
VADVLKYRLPNGNVVCKHGVFRVVDKSDFYGFVVQPFERGVSYGFYEGQDVLDTASERQLPVCYSKDEYLTKAKQYLGAFTNGEALKAILSRIKKVPFSCSKDDFFTALTDAYPNAFVYLIESELLGTWVGASPEVFVSRNADGVGSTMALAGTKVKEEGTDWSTKEIEEQKYVTDYIVERLEKAEANILRQDGPKTVDAGPVQHLRTDFEFYLLEDLIPDLIKDLHPTPAVCGLPKESAANIIDNIEDHDRELYTGYIGVQEDVVQLFVNLRCAQMIGNECFLYLGGGLTADSDPEAEWLETENKAKTLLNIIEKL